MLRTERFSSVLPCSANNTIMHDHIHGEKMIQFNNVTKIFSEGGNGLSDMSIRIDDGEFVFLVGKSGARVIIVTPHGIPVNARTSAA